MNCWEILDIEPTADEREIRRAYAKKLKVTRPDENPEGYQQLREAFDEALQIAPYYQEDDAQEESTESAVFQESESESAVNLPEEFSETAQAEIQPYQPEDPYDESNYQFEQMAIQAPEESQEPDYFAADALLSEVYRIATTEGETALETQWHRFHLELSELPLDQTDYVSWQAWHLFQDVQLENPFVWKQWSEYFNWHNDYKFAQYCDVERLAYVQERVHLAEQLNQVSTDDAVQERDTPILSAIYDRLSKRKSYVLTLFYLILISPFQKAEEYRYQWEYNQAIRLIPKLKDIFFYAGTCRLTLFICALIAYMPYIVAGGNGEGENTHFKLISFLAQSYISFFIILIIGGVLGSMIIYAKSFLYKPSLASTEKSMIIEGIIPLIILIIGLVMMPDIIKIPTHNFIIVAIIAWSLSKYLDEDYNFWASHFVPASIIVLILLSLEMVTVKNNYVIIASIVLWVNINMLIINFRFSLIRKMMEVNYKLCNILPA